MRLQSAIASLLIACTSGGGADRDAGEPDVGLDVACPNELCNGVDDDCDGATDEDFDLDSDIENCGSCGVACNLTPGVTGVSACVAGGCVVEPCADGRRNCDDNDANGCESELRDTGNCGECGLACTLYGAASACGSGSCEINSCNPGFDNCDARSENGCEVMIGFDEVHCGGCGVRCADNPRFASSDCVSGRCRIACDPGFADCNGSELDGCEANLSLPAHCGVCGVTCGEGELCSGSAATGFRCIPPPCVDPPTRCDESCVDTQTSVRHCGGCDSVCPTPPNTTPTCTAGECGLVCDSGFGDCDGNTANGCETSLRTMESCGGCGVRCSTPSGVAVCADGTCEIVGCAPGSRDCDRDPANGCEVDVTTDAESCGACGVSCGTGARCEAGACVTDCGPGLVDCGAGCEPLTNLEHCGACDRPCTGAPNVLMSCESGSCESLGCVDGFEDCNTVTADGCEADLGSDTDCGACGRRCPATASCDDGVCCTTGCDCYQRCDEGTCMCTAGCGCAFECPTEAVDCHASCRGAECKLTVGEDAELNQLVCADGAICSVEADDEESARVICEGSGTQCSIVCSDCNVQCDALAECVVRCEDGECLACEGVQRTCLDGTEVCNRACP